MRQVKVSDASARFIRKGHPWLRPDRFTRGLEACRPGESVTLVDRNGTPLASALADPESPIAARVYHKRGGKAFDVAPAIERAVSARAGLIKDEQTTCFRLIHGEGDFLPGLRVEILGPTVVVLIRSAAMARHLPAIGKHLGRHFPDHTLVFKHQIEDLRRSPLSIEFPGEFSKESTDTEVGLERGVLAELTPYADLATGIYVDQRQTREYLAPLATGKRILNLFAYTGLFSSALLKAGALEATDVDIAAPVLETAARNAAANGVADRHRTARLPAIDFLSKNDQQYDIVICDPPTAARGGDGWVLRKDYPKLLQALGPHLAPDSLLVAVCNTLGKRYDLDAALTQAGYHIENEKPQLGSDIPQIRGFPEGKPFALRLARYR